MLKLELKGTNLKFSWSIGRIKEILPGFDSPAPSTPKSCSGESLKSLATLVDEQMFPEAKIALASGVSAFLWLYINIQGYVSVISSLIESCCSSHHKMSFYVFILDQAAYTSSILISFLLNYFFLMPVNGVKYV